MESGKVCTDTSGTELKSMGSGSWNCQMVEGGLSVKEERTVVLGEEGPGTRSPRGRSVVLGGKSDVVENSPHGSPRGK